MKVLLKEAFCGVFKTNVTRYMVQLIKKNSYEKLLESLPLLYQVANNSNNVKKASLSIEINEIEKIAEMTLSFVIDAYECKIKQFNKNFEKHSLYYANQIGYQSNDFYFFYYATLISY